MRLSKSDYMLGTFCPKALWIKKHKKELLEDSEDAWSFYGSDIQYWAQKLYPDGIEVDVPTWEVDKGAELTEKLSEKNSVLFKAVAKLESGEFCRLDILQKDGSKWNLIVIKGTTHVKDEHLKDLAFQYFVFSNAGYKLKDCYVLHLNKAYKRKKKINLKKLFTLENVTTDVMAQYDNMVEEKAKLLMLQNKSEEPQIQISKKCQDCDFYNYCCSKVPEYSIWDVFSHQTADNICLELNSYDINDLVASDYYGKQFIDISAWQKQEIYRDKSKIQSFLKQLKYPLYYLDYETIEPAIPLFENSGPYQDIPFQFSLHVQKIPGGEVKHFSFLHKEKSDPRRSLAEALVKNCGKSGSVIVYNENFERKRNEELAELFPDLAKEILNINERLIDQLIPFRYRYLYHYKQCSSASIKKVLPSFTDLSYDNLEIHDGNEAMDRYLAFMNGKLTPNEEKILFDGLETYCAQDTYAMVLLMDVLYKNAQ